MERDLTAARHRCSSASSLSRDARPDGGVHEARPTGPIPPDWEDHGVDFALELALVLLFVLVGGFFAAA